MDQPFAFFDETGSMIQMSGRDVVQSAEQLNYRYDDEPLGAVRVFVAASMMESATGAPMADAQEGHLPTRPAFRSRWAPEPPPSRFPSKVRRPRWPPRGRGAARSSSA